jgi:hypothetical protein
MAAASRSNTNPQSQWGGYFLQNTTLKFLRHGLEQGKCFTMTHLGKERGQSPKKEPQSGIFAR